MSSLSESHSLLLVDGQTSYDTTSRSCLDPEVSDALDNVDVPQGRHLGLFSTLALFLSRMLGTGIFSIPSLVWCYVDFNPLLYFTIWFLAFLLALSGLLVFIELGTLSPKSGGKKNFLILAYDYPPLLICVTYSIFAILTGWAISNSIIFGQYFTFALSINHDFDIHFSILVILIVILIHGFSTKFGIIIQDLLAIIKFTIISFMGLIGLYTIFFFKNESHNNTISDDNLTTFHYSLPSAYILCMYCFSGWDSVHSVTSEIKNPNKSLLITGPLSLLLCLIFYTIINIAYYKILTKEEILNAGPLIGSIFFNKLFNSNISSTLFAISISLSAISNICVVIYSISRMNQQILRDGFLPFSKFLSSNWPYDAPLRSLSIVGGITIFWLLLVPTQSLNKSSSASSTAFDYLVNMEGYGNQFFIFLIVAGIYRIRNRITPLLTNNTSSTIKAPLISIIFFLTVSFYIIVTPLFQSTSWIDSSNNLPIYPIMSLILILFSFLYWFVMFILLPWLFNYTLVESEIVLDDGLIIKQWKRTY